MERVKCKSCQSETINHEHRCCYFVSPSAVNETFKTTRTIFEIGNSQEDKKCSLSLKFPLTMEKFSRGQHFYLLENSTIHPQSSRGGRAV
jgi:hypothetical protein